MTFNNFTFSDYKNHTTGKVFVWIYQHGSLWQCSDAEQFTCWICVLSIFPLKGEIFTTEKGFAIIDLCHE